MSDCAASLEALAAPAPPGSAHWETVGKRWRLLGPPLRPSPEDVGLCREAVREWARHRGAPRALILGVTPELYEMPWPEKTDLQAADRSLAMIEAVWPGPRAAVACADWRRLPYPARSRDVVLCDGGLHLLSYPEGQRELAREVARVLTPGGLCILRLFVPPSLREAPSTVLSDLVEGRIRDLNVLKMRLGPALQPRSGVGVKLSAVWRAVHGAAPDPEKLAAQIGWPLDHLMAIDSYKDCEDEYCFVEVEQAADLFCENGFAAVDLREPSYEIGDRCPTLVLRRR